MWGAAPLLVAQLAGGEAAEGAEGAEAADAPPGWLLGASVLELGAGAGLAGLAARRLGAARVALTDAGAPQLALLRENAALNAAPGADDAERVRVRFLDWAAPLDDAPCAAHGTPALGRGERFGVVLGADVLYEHAHAADVARALAARLAHDAAARALLVCPVRREATAAAFQAHAAQQGLACARRRLRGGDGAERYEGGYARFDLRWARERLPDAPEAR